MLYFDRFTLYFCFVIFCLQQLLNQHKWQNVFDVWCSAVMFPDDVRTQRAVVKRPESGPGHGFVSSALLLSHHQSGSQCGSLCTQRQQQQTHHYPCSRVGRLYLSITSQCRFLNFFFFIKTALVWSYISLCCSRVAADALRILLARAQLDEVIKRMDEDNAWDALREPNAHVSGITLLAR